jgi:hypothetical protein
MLVLSILNELAVFVKAVLQRKVIVKLAACVASSVLYEV